MAVSVKTEFHNGRIRITDFNYPYVEDASPDWTVEKGRLLSRGPGFPSNYEQPRLSFKVFCALHEGGSGEFARRAPSRVNSDNYRMCLDKLRSTLDVTTKLDPMPLDEAVKCILQSTSPGLPYICTHPDWKKDDIIASELDSIKEIWQQVANNEYGLFPDTAAFARSHIGGLHENKVRPVWVIPIAIIAQEARFCVPLTRELIEQRCCQNTGFGCEMMKGGMMWLSGQISMLNCHHGQTKIFMTDYTAFDSSVPAWLIRDVFSIVMEKFNLNEADVRKFKRCINYFINTPIQNSDGRRFKKEHGIPSGSMFTTLIRTLVNMVVSWYGSVVVFGYLPLMDIYFGDNGVVCYPCTAIMDLDAYAFAIKDVFGMTINTEKSYWTWNLLNVHFLGYQNYYGSTYKNPIDLVAAMLFPQHLIDDWDYCISCALECLLASGGLSSDVFEACRAVYKKAVQSGADPEIAIKLMKSNPRSLRHLITMGVDDITLSAQFFDNYKLSIPCLSCAKFTKGVQLWKMNLRMESEVLTPGQRIRPPGDSKIVADLLEKLYNLRATTIKELNSYDDRNYHVLCEKSEENDVNEHGYVLKIVNSLDSKKGPVIDAQTEMLIFLNQRNISCPFPVKNLNGTYHSLVELSEEDGSTESYAVRLLVYRPGELLHRVPITSELLRNVGGFTARLDNILTGFSHPAYDDHKTLWMLTSVPNLRQFTYALKNPLERVLAHHVILAFERNVLYVTSKLEQGMIHGDLNEQNIVMGPKASEIAAVIDFGDAHRTCLIFELAIVLCYMILQAGDLAMGKCVVDGYQEVRKLTDLEKRILKITVCARICQSLVMGMYSYLQDPQNEYLLVTQKSGWALLNELWPLEEEEVLRKWGLMD